MTAQSSRDPLGAGLAEQPSTPQGEPADPEPRHPSGPVLQIDLVDHAGDWSAFGNAVARMSLAEAAANAVARASCAAARLPAIAEAVVALSCDDDVAALNAQYRGKCKPTNVLSFPANAAFVPGTIDDEPVQLGDIILAAETVLAEAADMGLAPADHLRHLIVHGLLHLLGFDHIDATEAEQMEALETTILASMGVADPYAGSEPLEAPS